MLSESQSTKVLKQLREFDCNEREAHIYLQTLQLGPSSVQELAKALGLNRVTVHSAVEQLISKGLLYETRKGKKRLIVAEPPSIFSQIIQTRESELSLMKENLDQLTAVLDPLRVTDTSVPSVKFYEGVDGFKRMLEETLSAKNEALVITYVELFSELLDPAYLENYFKRRADRGIHTRLIFPPCSFADKVNKKRERYNIDIRLLPADLHWRSGIFAWNDSIAVKSFTEGKINCTIIENADIADFWRRIVFELAWTQAKPIS